MRRAEEEQHIDLDWCWLLEAALIRSWHNVKPKPNYRMAVEPVDKVDRSENIGGGEDELIEFNKKGDELYFLAIESRGDFQQSVQILPIFAKYHAMFLGMHLD